MYIYIYIYEYIYIYILFVLPIALPIGLPGLPIAYWPSRRHNLLAFSEAQPADFLGSTTRRLSREHNMQQGRSLVIQDFLRIPNIRKKTQSLKHIGGLYST